MPTSLPVGRHMGSFLTRKNGDKAVYAVRCQPPIPGRTIASFMSRKQDDKAVYGAAECGKYKIASFLTLSKKDNRPIYAYADPCCGGSGSGSGSPGSRGSAGSASKPGSRPGSIGPGSVSGSLAPGSGSAGSGSVASGSLVSGSKGSGPAVPQIGPTMCCPSRTLPAILHFTVVNKTGNCATCMFFANGGVLYIVAGGAPGGEATYNTGYTNVACATPGYQALLTLTCSGAGWDMSIDVGLPTRVLVSASCDPFQIVFDVTMPPGAPSQACFPGDGSGTFRVIITE